MVGEYLADVAGDAFDAGGDAFAVSPKSVGSSGAGGLIAVF
jgi:hypothetical protein